MASTEGSITVNIGTQSQSEGQIIVNIDDSPSLEEACLVDGCDVVVKLKNSSGAFIEVTKLTSFGFPRNRANREYLCLSEEKKKRKATGKLAWSLSIDGEKCLGHAGQSIIQAGDIIDVSISLNKSNSDSPAMTGKVIVDSVNDNVSAGSKMTFSASMTGIDEPTMYKWW